MTNLKIIRAAGDSLDDAWLMGERTPADPDERGFEALIGRVTGGRIREVFRTWTILDGLVSDGASVVTTASRESASSYVRQSDALWVFRDDGGLRVEATALEAPDTRGLRRLHDGTLMSWPSLGVEEEDPLLWLDPALGQHPIPEPPFEEVETIDGTSTAFLVAGSLQGEVAIFDGRAWTPAHQLGSAKLGALCVVHPGEVLVAGADPDVLYAFDGQAWTARASCPAAVTSLVRHQGAIFGASAAGLLRLEGDSWREVPLPLPSGRRAVPHDLCSGSTLLVTGPDFLAEIDEQGAVRAIEIEELERVIGDRTPLWQTAALDSDPRVFARPLPREKSLLDPMRTRFQTALGCDALEDTIFVGLRSEDVERPSSEERESFLGRIHQGIVAEITVTSDQVYTIDRSPSGTTYAAVWSEQSGLWRRLPGPAHPWERLDAPMMSDVFALSDDCVMCWSAIGDTQLFYVLDGARARPIPAPSSWIVGVHGCAPDWIVAVGEHGYAARWDGAAWHPWPTPLAGTLSTILVVSPDEMYATGPHGALLQGSRHGWVERAPSSGAVVSIARFRGELYLADLVEGLLRVQGPDLVPLELPVWPRRLHATPSTLTMSERDWIVVTSDLETLRSTSIEEVELALRHRRPTFR